MPSNEPFNTNDAYQSFQSSNEVANNHDHYRQFKNSNEQSNDSNRDGGICRQDCDVRNQNESGQQEEEISLKEKLKAIQKTREQHELERRTSMRVKQYQQQLAGMEKKASCEEETRNKVLIKIQSKFPLKGPLWKLLRSLGKWDKEFKFDVRWNTPPKQLEKARRMAMMKLHPDRHVKATPYKKIFHEELFKIVSTMRV
eukprot:TRINITY_DN4061_c0_g1_i7.p3 TRINITY_DN4061_c0_g1~~TRINITY_DN4061_c0_g1_i7.p3  ORF type:complete len:199 (-),score=20.95 TRINITY_DN4061_c0_g1_i7:707-1303(-)